MNARLHQWTVVLIFGLSLPLTGCPEFDLFPEEKCGPDSCSGNGTCDDSTELAVCTCDDGYSGEFCGDCAQGYYWGNDVCVPNEECQDDSCNEHGICDDSNGAIQCDCNDAYTGDNCDMCAQEYQDNNANGVCLPNCAYANLDCAGHGMCTDENGLATCLCEYGWVPDNEQGCVPNLALAGEDCTLAIELPVADGSVTGRTVDSSNNAEGECVGIGPDKVFTFTLDEPMRAEFYVEGSAVYDSGLHLRTTCEDAASEVACNDDGEYDANSHLVEVLSEGTYFLWVDSYLGGGEFELIHSFSVNPCNSNSCEMEGMECTPSDDWSSYSCDCDADTILIDGQCLENPCEPNPCQSLGQSVCQVAYPGYVCKCDYGWIPDVSGGCVIDADLNGNSCGNAIALSIETAVISGSMQGAEDSALGNCGGFGPDRVYQFTLDEARMATIYMDGLDTMDTVLYLRNRCDEPSSEIDCNDDSFTSEYSGLNSEIAGVLAPGTYYLWADSYDYGGEYELSVSFEMNPC